MRPGASFFVREGRRYLRSLPFWTKETHWPWFLKPYAAHPPFLQSSAVTGFLGMVTVNVPFNRLSQS